MTTHSRTGHATSPPRELLLLFLLGVACVACADGSAGGRDIGGASTGQKHGGYAPTRFRFKPGMPGRATGVRAEIELPERTLATNEIELELLMPEDGPTATADMDVQTSDAGQTSSLIHSLAPICSTHVGQTPAALGTQSASICWLSFTFSGGTLGAGASLATMLFTASEGMYLAGAKSVDVYVPPDFVNVGDAVSVGCVVSPQGETISVDYLNSLQTLSISGSIGAFAPLTAVSSLSVGPSVGVSMLIESASRVARGFQYDTGIVGISFGFPVLGTLPTLRFTAESGFVHPPRMVRRFDGACPAADSDASSEDLRRLAVEALAPALAQLQNGDGFGPGPNMMAGSNADAFQSLGGGGAGRGCSSCPPSTLDDVLQEFNERFAGAEDNAEIAAAGAHALQGIGNVLPSRLALDTSLRQAVSGIQLLDLASQWEQLDQARAVVDRRVVVIDSRVGERVTLQFDAAEVARVSGLPEAAVLGATLRVDGSPVVSASEHVLEETDLSLSFAPRVAGQVVVRTLIDLTTAQGPIPAELTGRYLELAVRLIRVAAGAPARAVISSVGKVASGGAVTVSAAVVDEHGNVVTSPARVRFYDGSGAEIGSAMTAHGVSALQYVPVPSIPAITSVVPEPLMLRDGASAEGLRITGAGFSLEADIYLDGTLLDRATVPRSTPSSKHLLVATSAPLGASVRVVNPGGASDEAIVGAL